MASRLVIGENDLATTHPDLAAEWHPTLNERLSPSDIMAGQSIKVWWLCSLGHHWAALPYPRTKGVGCAVCAGKSVIAGVNDMRSTHPELAQEFHPTRNGDATPENLIAGTNRTLWWICGLGHEWQSPGGRRVSGGSGCPYCAGQRVLFGYNDLATLRPDLAKEWHPIKNGDLLPEQIVPGHSLRVWWICQSGHEWDATPHNRLKGDGCPYCSGRRVWPGYNDLATTHPDLAKQWHPDLNGGLLASDVLGGGKRRHHWKCDNGHDWLATVVDRRGANGTGCPYCSGHRVWPGYNDLATTHPDLAKEWHSTRNGTLTPFDITSGTSRKVWWACKAKHEWAASVHSRVMGRSCPYCAGYFAWPGYNDLATTHPDLAKQWDFDKNKTLTPQTVTASTNKRIWWLCADGHSWSAISANRVTGRGCPACARSGFDQTKPGILYFLTSREFNARKVGITNVGTTRLADFTRSGWQVVSLKETHDGLSVARVEKAVFYWLRHELQLPAYLGREEMRQTGGWTETFGMEGPSDAEVIARIEAEFARLGDSIA